MTVSAAANIVVAVLVPLYGAKPGTPSAARFGHRAGSTSPVDWFVVKLRLPGRRSPDAAAPDTAQDLTDQLVKEAGKGRPTPKRSEAQGRRLGPPPPPPTTRKEAYRRMRETQATNRPAARAAAARGDDSYLPARDRGRVRKLVRDLIDTRRNIGSLFLFVALIAVVGTVVPNLLLRAYTSYLLTLYFIVFIVDAVVLSRRIKKAIAERYPDDSAKGAVWYGITRTTMIRRWRFPKPDPSLFDER